MRAAEFFELAGAGRRWDRHQEGEMIPSFFMNGYFLLGQLLTTNE
ncbi:hypothetical protein I541_5769 [Mycobacteroides abscessus]|nr:hypothetical protein I541_5769 [Mycobacteroides abscessus]